MSFDFQICQQTFLKTALTCWPHWSEVRVRKMWNKVPLQLLTFKSCKNCSQEEALILQHVPKILISSLPVLAQMSCWAPITCFISIIFISLCWRWIVQDEIKKKSCRMSILRTNKRNWIVNRCLLYARRQRGCKKKFWDKNELIFSCVFHFRISVEPHCGQIFHTHSRFDSILNMCLNRANVKIVVQKCVVANM